MNDVTKILDGLRGRRGDKDFPVFEETFNEILHDAMDLDHALEVVGGIQSKKIKVSHNGYSDNPSPFAHNIVLIGASDIILMEDRSSLLRELHKKILGKLMAEMPGTTIDPEQIAEYFRNKVPVVNSKEDLVDVDILGQRVVRCLFCNQPDHAYLYTLDILDEVGNYRRRGFPRLGMDEVSRDNRKLSHPDYVEGVLKPGIELVVARCPQVVTQPVHELDYDLTLPVVADGSALPDVTGIDQKKPLAFLVRLLPHLVNQRGQRRASPEPRGKLLVHEGGL